ncbi:MAG: hypothetical protein A2V92_00360 [Candidatus Muproteobacteria bacterium RBG_16_65_31]|uniref:Glucose-6-phosphate isomerase n=1 Tax=Candidatus Muproteobacteria bacterium RBG_16_65_31 TaxID=1817759 RepID=A0A1F6TG35_9PROT|nr:MAG: hypothetical protein A2V92_00360 [Candidatus Muproteobacteria bacterium RBG_16_65_31]
MAARKKTPTRKRREAPEKRPEETRLHIDTRNMYRGAGVDGVATADLDAVAEQLRGAHRALSAGSRGGLEAEYACLNLPQAMVTALPEIGRAAAAIRRHRDVLVLGIGGSSLGARAVYEALRPGAPRAGGPRLHFLENIDPDYVAELVRRLRPEATALICISKSGGTLETVIQYLVLRRWLEQSLGPAAARRRQWLITDPAAGWLRALAARAKIAALPVPPKVGGRYSVLSAVGLLPLAVAGDDVAALLRGAAENAARCATDDVRQNPALEIAALHYLLDVRKGRRTLVMMPYANPLRLFADWFCQLWAESLGKRTGAGAPAGTMPVRALGAVDQHSQLQMYLESRPDKMFTFVALARWERDLAIPLAETEKDVFPFLADKKLGDVMDAEFRATRAVITEAGHPNMTVTLDTLNAHAMGQLIDLYQRATIYAGLLYGVNPLDQPAVEKGKLQARRFLENNGRR